MVEQGGGGSGGGGGGRSRGKKGKSVSHNLKVTLEEVYNGNVRKLRLSRVIIDKAAGVKTCSQCGGRGVVIRTMQMGPMIQRVQSACPNSQCDKGTVCSKKNTKE